MQHFAVVVLGAGAAGLMCAIDAGRRGRRVLLLDHAGQAGEKILISGGGRCNFTNLHTAPDRFLSDNPHFCKLGPAPLHARRTSSPWSSRTASPGTRRPWASCSATAPRAPSSACCWPSAGTAGVDLRLAHRVTDVARPDGLFRIATDHGDFSAESLVLATGGLSIPKIGATGFAHEVARKFGLRLTEIAPRPGAADVRRRRAGADAAAQRRVSGCGGQTATGTCFREAMLFTHRGLSGPAILQISSVWRPGRTIAIDLLPGLDAAAWLLERKRLRPARRTGDGAGRNPAAAAGAGAGAAGVCGAGARPIAELPDRALAALAGALKSWLVVPTGSEGYGQRRGHQRRG